MAIVASGGILGQPEMLVKDSGCCAAILHQSLANSADCLLQLLDRAGKRNSHVARSAEGAARHHQHISLIEQQLHEIAVLREPFLLYRARDARKGIERTFALAAFEARNLVQGIDNVITCSLIAHLG